MQLISAVKVRDRTVKKNCRYRVVQVPAVQGTVKEYTIQLVQQFRADIGEGQKGVIYCRSKKQCESMAEDIGCGFHHSGMSAVDRREVREVWAEGRAAA